MFPDSITFDFTGLPLDFDWFLLINLTMNSYWLHSVNEIKPRFVILVAQSWAVWSYRSEGASKVPPCLKEAKNSYSPAAGVQTNSRVTGLGLFCFKTILRAFGRKNSYKHLTSGRELFVYPKGYTWLEGVNVLRVNVIMLIKYKQKQRKNCHRASSVKILCFCACGNHVTLILSHSGLQGRVVRGKLAVNRTYGLPW